MDDIVPLTEVKSGIRYKVVRILGGHGIRHKLRVLGITEGRIIKKISTQPMRGPIIIEVMGSQIAIGFGMAKRIIVEKEL